MNTLITRAVKFLVTHTYDVLGDVVTNDNDIGDEIRDKAVRLVAAVRDGNDTSEDVTVTTEELVTVLADLVVYSDNISAKVTNKSFIFEKLSIQ